MSTILTNARIVLADEEMYGTIAFGKGGISDIATGRSGLRSAIDCEGEYVLPGLIDVHSDNLERHISPRPNVVLPARLAAIAHDAETVGMGITTVFDAVGLSGGKAGSRAELFEVTVGGLIEASQNEALRADHFLHIRCEVSDPEVVSRYERIADSRLVRMISLMDHTPGQRVFRDVEMWRDYRRKGLGMSDKDLDAELERATQAHLAHATINRNALAKDARHRGLIIAAHDDATVDDVSEGLAVGGTISEFPTTLEAAVEAVRHGMSVVMGSPNLIKGRSHIGNVSASDCARHGVLNILASDYVPGSLLLSIIMLTQDPIGLTLQQAVRKVTINPASALGLNDRGEVAIGKRADLLRMRLCGGVPVIRSIWKAGERVH